MKIDKQDLRKVVANHVTRKIETNGLEEHISYYNKNYCISKTNYLYHRGEWALTKWKHANSNGFQTFE